MKPYKRKIIQQYKNDILTILEEKKEKIYIIFQDIKICKKFYTIFSFIWIKSLNPKTIVYKSSEIEKRELEIYI